MQTSLLIPMFLHSLLSINMNFRFINITSQTSLAISISIIYDLQKQLSKNDMGAGKLRSLMKIVKTLQNYQKNV